MPNQPRPGAVGHVQIVPRRHLDPVALLLLKAPPVQDLPPVDLDREVPLPRAAAEAVTERVAQHKLVLAPREALALGIRRQRLQLGLGQHRPSFLLDLPRHLVWRPVGHTAH